jgi:hypothetical protein
MVTTKPKGLCMSEATRTAGAPTVVLVHGAFAADLPAAAAGVLAAIQRPVAEPAFSEPTGAPAWRQLPSWAVVATADQAAGTDVVLDAVATVG